MKKLMQNKHERLQKRVKKLEEKLRIIVGDSVWKWFATRCSHVEVEKIIGLLNQRKGLLDKMFVATPEEIVRMEKVNDRLLELTNMLFVRTEELCHKTMINNYDPTFDNDVDVEGTLKFEMNDSASILPMNDDDYYGSNFLQVFEIISCLYAYNYLSCEAIELSYCYCLPDKYSMGEGRDKLQIADTLNDGKSWYHACMPAANKMNHLCICHAIYDLNMHKPYSIPDILRMNDFVVEVAVKHQYFADQKGRCEV